MNKFLLWHTLRKEFVQPYRNIVFDDNGITESDLCTIHNYIGLKDGNNNKIYADCSIVEFECCNIKFNGVFRYSKEDLYFYIEVIKDDTGIREDRYGLVYSAKEIKNFKIIDTIQENKLGLIK